MMNQILHFRPIGKVVSPVTQPVDEKWGDVVSEIHLKHELTSGLTGLATFSHVQVMYFMQESNWNPVSDLIRRPQGRADMPMVGIFAQRAKHRPNPIGTTAVRLVSVKDNVVTVKGLDAVDGTLVLDIKPYYPAFDLVYHAVVPEWVDVLMKNYFAPSTPVSIKAAGNVPKTIEEFFGRVSSKMDQVSIARMKSPEGWSEPGQTPDFDEYSVILKGMLRIASRDRVTDILEGQGVLCRRGQWVQYSTPNPGGAEYISVCLPAFAPDLVHRDAPGK